MRSETARYVTYKRRDAVHSEEYAIQKCLYQQTCVEKKVDNALVVPYNQIL